MRNNFSVRFRFENVLSLFSKRSRRLSTSLSKRRMTSLAKADVEESLDAIADLNKQVEAIEKEKKQDIQEVNQRWDEIAAQESEVTVTPLKKDVMLDVFGVAWMPFYLAGVGWSVEEVEAYKR